MIFQDNTSVTISIVVVVVVVIVILIILGVVYWHSTSKEELRECPSEESPLVIESGELETSSIVDQSIAEHLLNDIPLKWYLTRGPVMIAMTFKPEKKELRWKYLDASEMKEKKTKILMRDVNFVLKGKDATNFRKHTGKVIYIAPPRIYFSALSFSFFAFLPFVSIEPNTSI